MQRLTGIDTSVAPQTSVEELLNLLYQMLFIRRFEERVGEMYTRGKVGGYVHLNIGEEASIVGAYSALAARDVVFTSYREHGHALARGIEPRRVMAELFGKETGVSRGRGGSMHMMDRSKGFMGGWGIVGGHLPLAVGAAFAHKYRGGDGIVACFFGDGATNIGAFHESLNLAKIWRLPILFVLVNNQYGMGTAIERVSALAKPYQKASAYGIGSERADGMDVLATRNACVRCVDMVRTNSEPYLLELLTYRFKGHSVSDPSRYRDAAEVKRWTDDDPIGLFQLRLQEAGIVDPSSFMAMERRIDAEIGEAVTFAEESPFPSVASLYDHVLYP